ncbi:MAG TPA: N-acyl homoserine lactonase family protein [Herpetosiphonaceae bacterium]|nr:N-acyl homoserine lactonase family protein [Herpetosiphonaceae bacterium]
MRLYLLQLALHPELGIPVPGYLIRADDGTNVLIDSGFPKNYAPQALGGRQLADQDYVVDQLAALGLAPDDIDYLVCTHFDPDHAGGHDAFRRSELIVQREHYEFAKAGGHPRLELMRERWGHPGLRYRLIDGDTTLLPGVELIATGGHMPGHQSVLVRLPVTGAVILAIDAVADGADFTPDRQDIGPPDLDAEQTRRSTARLVELARREQAALVVFGHDQDQWPTLRRAPEFYD